MVEKSGWFLLPRTGTSHRQYKHSTRPGRVTIAGHPGDDADPKTQKQHS
ncbi:MAG: type II toxin-antitoxin system HicA family toxin [Bryobacteraceae bacterium]